MSVTPIQSNSYDTLPGVTTQAATAKAAAAAPNSSTATSSSNVTNLSSTFLQLLTQELQNQDPTAPMDSTQMVAQMISLNQLEQLASINQTLTKSAASAAQVPGANANAPSAAAAQAALHAASLGTTLGDTSSALHTAGVSGL